MCRKRLTGAAIRTLWLLAAIATFNLAGPVTWFVDSSPQADTLSQLASESPEIDAYPEARRLLSSARCPLAKSVAIANIARQNALEEGSSYRGIWNADGAPLSLEQPIVVSRGACLEISGAEPGAAQVSGDSTASFVISGSGRRPLFIVKANAKLVLAGVTLENGRSNSTDSKGAIIELGGAVTAKKGADVSLHQVVLRNNSANGKGGALLLQGASAWIFDSTFISNAAGTPGTKGAPSTMGSGGAIAAVDGASAHLVNVVMKNNTATISGGSLYINESNMDIHSSKCLFNTAGEGPADDGHVEGDSDTSGGGCVFVQDGTLNVAGEAVFNFNTADKGSAIMAYVSDSLSAKQHSVSIRDAEISGNNGWRKTDCASNRTGQGALWTAGNVSLDNVVFADNTHAASGAIHIEPKGSCEGGGKYCLTLNAVNCTFRGNTACYGGVVWHKAGAVLEATYESCQFRDNAADDSGGGVLNLAADTRTVVIGSVFENNFAKLFGGTAWTAGGVELDIRDSNFTTNSSPRGGAIYAAEGHGSGRIFLDNVIFDRNSADYEGGAMWLQARSLGNATRTSFLNNTANDGGAVFALQPADYQVTDCKFIGNAAGRAGGALLQAGAAGDFNIMFDDATAFEGNGAQCCYIGGYGTSEERRGGLYTCSDVDSVSNANCCPNNTYMAGAQCQQCDPRLLQCDHTGIGYSTLPLLSSMWRGTNVTGEEDVLECWNRAACKGGTDFGDTGDGYCSEGYTGSYCAVCAQGYASFLTRTCYKCTAGIVAAVSLAVVVVIALAILIIAATAYFDVQSNKASLDTDGIPVARSGRKRDAMMAKVGEASLRLLRCLRIPIVVFQVLTQYFQIAGVPLPDLYEQFLVWLNFVNVDLGSLLSSGCLWNSDFYDRLLLVTLLPLGIAALLCGAYAACQRRAQASGQRGKLYSLFVKRAGLLLLTLSFLVFSSSSTIIFQTFACDRISGTDDEYLRADYSVSCTDPRHARFKVYAAFMIFVYPIGIPAAYLALLRRRRVAIRGVPDEDTGSFYSRADDSELDPQLRAVAFLWQPYARRYYYWEVVECGRRLLLTGVLVFIRPGSIGQSAYACVFAYVSIAVYLLCQPHLNRQDTYLYGLGATIVFITYFVTLMAQTGGAGAHPGDNDATALLLILLNIALGLAAVLQAFLVAGLARSAVETMRSSMSDITRLFHKTPSDATCTTEAAASDSTLNEKKRRPSLPFVTPVASALPRFNSQSLRRVSFPPTS
eukprot:TRINITY_DN18761_c0_g1_i1.p1 TRINITY_DN18761_c0_g1~~TRINITY_DN18761_c0_g1_i1.p1  ORF type:complete len:1245 (+),score=365.94 TRINITY_DN18761_c0_g1_i1:193-3927(+)